MDPWVIIVSEEQLVLREHQLQEASCPSVLLGAETRHCADAEPGAKCGSDWSKSGHLLALLKGRVVWRASGAAGCLARAASNGASKPKYAAVFADGAVGGQSTPNRRTRSGSVDWLCVCSRSSPKACTSRGARSRRRSGPPRSCGSRIGA